MKTVSLKIKISMEGRPSPSDQWKTMTSPWQYSCKVGKAMENKRRIASRSAGPHGREGITKRNLLVAAVMQCKLRERNYVKEFHWKTWRELTSRWSFNKKCNRSKCCRMTKERVHLVRLEMVQGMVVNPPKAPEEGAWLKASRYGYNQEKKSR